MKNISITETTIKFNGFMYRKWTTDFCLIAPFTVADLSSLRDFELFKSRLQIINKTYVTFGRPFVFNKVSL